MIRFEGVESLPLPPAEVYAKLTDAGWLARALPEAEVVETAPDRAAWKVRPKFAFMAGSLDTVADLLERVPGERARFRIVSKGVGSSSTAEAGVDIAPDDGGTLVRWSADVVDLGGLLKMVPRGLIQAAAQRVIADVWASIREKLTA